MTEDSGKTKSLCTATAEDDRHLCLAAERGDAKTVESLLLEGRGNPSYGLSEPLYLAAKRGHTAVVRLLLPHSDAKAMESRALTEAAANGHRECVEALLPLSCPADGNNRPLTVAVLNGHAEIARTLLPISDLGRYNPLRTLAGKQDSVCFELLFPHSSEDDKAKAVQSALKARNTRILSSIREMESHLFDKPYTGMCLSIIIDKQYEEGLGFIDGFLDDGIIGDHHLLAAAKNGNPRILSFLLKKTDAGERIARLNDGDHPLGIISFIEKCALDRNKGFPAERISL